MFWQSPCSYTDAINEGFAFDNVRISDDLGIADYRFWNITSRKYVDILNFKANSKQQIQDDPKERHY